MSTKRTSAEILRRPPVAPRLGADPDDGIASVEILRLQPGDVVVLTARAKLSQDAIERIEAIARPAFPDGVRVMVLDDSMSLSVVRPPAPGATA